MRLIFIILLFITNNYLKGQENIDISLAIVNDTIKYKNLNEVIITATRAKTPLNQLPTATSIITEDILNTMPKSIAGYEALRLVPGIRLENEDDDSRLHLSIRGQGILSERGIRGIKILIDGIPVNDPGGFAPDLYEVDWATVKNIEVMRGPESSLYGSSSSAGIVNINTMDGGTKPLNVMLYEAYGSNAFWKTLAQVDGTVNKINYRLTYSHMMGDGYRQHSAYKSDNLNEKLNWNISDKFKITQMFSAIGYFNQIAESINLQEVNENPRLANPDAIPFNEYQKTQRFSNAISGRYEINKKQNIQVNGFIKTTNFKQADDKAADYRSIITDGFSAQYNYKLGKGNLVNHFSIGMDYESQSITEHQFKGPTENEDNDKDADTDEDEDDNKYDETYNQSDTLLANQLIKQKSTGVFFIDKMVIFKKLYATVNLRYDYLSNTLSDRLNKHLDDSGNYIDENLSGSRNFNKTTAHFGLAYDLTRSVNIYADWGTGFLPPSTEELANNPEGFGGFNPLIVPSTSENQEIGIRGNIGKHIYYDLDGFLMYTKNDFYRYLLSSVRGNHLAFFGNISASKRYGVESSLKYHYSNLSLSAAYTYSDFRYTSPDSINNHLLPEIPQHQLKADVSYNFLKHLTAGIGTEFQSKWHIFTNAQNYDLTANGYNIYNFRIAYEWKLWKINSVVSFNICNLTDRKYLSFTEPDLQLYSYNPAAGREYFINLRIRY